MISLFKMAPKFQAEVHSGVPKSKKAAMCLMEKMCLINELPSGMHCRAGGQDCEFNDNESTIYIEQGVFQWEHT